MAKVLLTGFEAFGGSVINPSEIAVSRLDGTTIAGSEVVGLTLPCAFGSALDVLRHAIHRHRPKLVVCAGQAGGRSEISIERIAINVDDARIPDNLGAQPIDQPIVRSGPPSYWSTLPIKSIVHELQLAGIKSGVSQTAGTFVCNHVFYGLMRTLAPKKGVRGGFVHVPYIRSQVQEHRTRPPTMPMTKIVRGLEVVIHTSLTTTRDLRAPGGSLH